MKWPRNPEVKTKPELNVTLQKELFDELWDKGLFPNDSHSQAYTSNPFIFWSVAM